MIESSDSFSANPIDDEVPDMSMKGIVSLEKTMSAYFLHITTPLQSTSPLKNQIIAEAPKPVYLSWAFSINSDSAHGFIKDFCEFHSY